MADVALSIIQFEDLFQALTVAILGWGDVSPVKTNDVRIGWLNAPAFKKTENIVFLKCIEIEGAYNKQRDVLNVDRVVSVSPSVKMVTQQTGYTRIMQVDFILYGSDAFENAQAIRDGMFTLESRNTLALQNIYLIPTIAAPKRVPELFGTQWWDRTDLSITFNELIIREPEVRPIESAEIITSDKSGEISDITVTDEIERRI